MPAKPNFANETKGKANLKPVTSVNPRDRGTRYTAVVDSAEPTFYSTGSFGIKIKYVVEGMQKAVYENVVLRTIDKTSGNPTATKYGDATLKRRLAAAGLTSDEVDGFEIPKTAENKDAFGAIIGAGVAIYLAPRDYMGKTYYDVKSVWPLENTNE